MTGSSSTAWPLFAWFWFIGVMEQLHPGAATGAAFGCVFFMFFPDPQGKMVLTRKIGLLIFSWGAGYAIGKDVSGFNMAWAIGISTVAATLAGAANLMIGNNGPLPEWLKSTIDAILRNQERR